jgi:hypothetical protein
MTSETGLKPPVEHDDSIIRQLGRCRHSAGWPGTPQTTELAELSDAGAGRAERPSLARPVKLAAFWQPSLPSAPLA